MIIVKLTVLSFVLTAIMIWFIKIWAQTYPEKVMIASITKNYPKWMALPFGYLIIFDVIGIISSLIWFLFFM